MSLDLVWIVGGPPDGPEREELRYSIRSFEQNFTAAVRDVWVVGDPPEWFAGARMALEPKPGKFENQRASIAAYVNYPGAAETFVLLNDDMFLTEPVATLPTCRNKATASEWETSHDGAGHGPDCWKCAVKDTAAWAAERTGSDPHLYECHTPLTFDTAKLRDAINQYPTDRRFVVGELYPIAGAGGDGHHHGNAKVKAADSLDAKLALDMPYLSGNPDSWQGALGGYVRTAFAKASRFEKLQASVAA